MNDELERAILLFQRTSIKLQRIVLSIDEKVHSK